METLSSRLKREREQRNITLQEISLSTKICMRFLIAIEDGRFEQLPGGIISRGFLRAYSRQIGIDENETIAEYLAIIRANQPEEPADPTTRSTRELQSKVKEMGLSQWALTAACLLLSFAVAEFVYNQGEPLQYDEPAIASSPQPHRHPVVESAVVVDSQTRRDQPSEPESLNPPASQETRATVNSENGRTARLDGANPTNLPLSGVVPTPPDGFSVSVTARDDAWLSIFVDGKRILQTTLEAPAEMSMGAHQQIAIRAGNIGALDFSFNGQRMPPMGDYDEARTLIFDGNGLEEPVLKASTTARIPGRQ